MANHLMQRANDEESPLLREQLQKKAEEINQAANEFINAVNDLLQDPENPEAVKRVNDAAERLRQLMDDTTGQLKAAEAEVPSGMEAVLPSMEAVKGNCIITLHNVAMYLPNHSFSSTQPHRIDCSNVTCWPWRRAFFSDTSNR